MTGLTAVSNVAGAAEANVTCSTPNKAVVLNPRAVANEKFMRFHYWRKIRTFCYPLPGYKIAFPGRSRLPLPLLQP